MNHCKFRSRIGAGAALLFALGQGAEAHVHYIPLENQQTGYANVPVGNRGWSNGTRDALGDSHHMSFFKFTLTQKSIVDISFATQLVQRINSQGQVTAEFRANLDPAFSLYRGLLPHNGHDYANYDATIVVDLDTGTYAASPTDRNPDPNWVYTSHDGFRDTLNYSTLGGLDPFGEPIAIFEGQFDALGSWSMSNAAPDDTGLAPGSGGIVEHPDGTATLTQDTVAAPDGPVTWAKVKYITHRNDHEGVGDTPDLSTETARLLLLEPGDYTIAAAGGCPGCPGPGPEQGGATESFGGAMTYTARACSTRGTKAILGTVANGIVDAFAGTALSETLEAVDCDGDDISIKLIGKVPTGASLQAPGQTDPNTQIHSQTFNWTPTAEQAGTAGKLYTLGFQAETPAKRSSSSRVQSVKVRVWPAGMTPDNAFSITVKTAQWSDRRGQGKLTVGGSIRFNPILTKAERTALLASGQLTLNDPDSETELGQPITVNSRGTWSTVISASQTPPCEITASFGGKTSDPKAVKNVPANNCANGQ